MTLREAFDYRFSPLDPRGAAHIDPTAVAVYETLLVKGDDQGPRPALAVGWEVSDDGLAWRLRLRPSARFHSGERCDAAAVVGALEHLRWGEERRGQLWYWNPVDEVRAEGEEVVCFTLRHPYARLPSLLWGTHTAIHNEGARRRAGADYGRMEADGTGPFRLAAWSPERVAVEAWPDWPGPGPQLERIEWRSLLDEEERLMALERGEVHSLHGPPLGEVERLREDGRFAVVEFTQASNAYLALDFRRRDLGFDDVEVRRALSQAIDRRAIVREALAGHGSPTLGPLSPADEYYDPAVDWTDGHDPQRARALLSERDLVFDCVCQDDAVHRRIAACLREQLHAVGVRLELRFVRPFADFYAACAAGPASFVNKWLWQDGLDAVIGFASSGTRGFPNWQHASIPDLDAAFAVWLEAGTHENLTAAATRAQRIVAEQLPYVPLVTPNDVWVHARSLRGWRPHPANLYPTYEEAWIDADG